MAWRKDKAGYFMQNDNYYICKITSNGIVGYELFSGMNSCLLRGRYQDCKEYFKSLTNGV